VQTGLNLPLRTQAALAFPLWLLALVVLGTWRGHEGTMLQGQLSLTAAAFRWSLFVWGCGGAFWLLLGRLSLRNGAFGGAEWLFSQGALIALWAVVGFCANLLTLLLLLEVASLLVLVLIAHSPVPTLPTRGGAGQLSLLKAVLFFIWLTALAALLMFWGLLQGFSRLGTLDIALWPLVAGTSAAGSAATAPLFYLGLGLKLLLPPFQLVAFALYRHVPAASLAAYLAFYYPFSLAAGFGLFWFQLLPALGAHMLVPALGGALGAAVTLLFLDTAASLRGLLAFSTVANLGVLLLAASL